MGIAIVISVPALATLQRMGKRATKFLGHSLHTTKSWPDREVGEGA